MSLYYYRKYLKRERLQIGAYVQLWPHDTYPKYARVTAADAFTVTFEITRVHPYEPYYKPGMRVRIPWDRVKYIKQ